MAPHTSRRRRRTPSGSHAPCYPGRTPLGQQPRWEAGEATPAPAAREVGRVRNRTMGLSRYHGVLAAVHPNASCPTAVRARRDAAPTIGPRAWRRPPCKNCLTLGDTLPILRRIPHGPRATPHPEAPAASDRPAWAMLTRPAYPVPLRHRGAGAVHWGVCTSGGGSYLTTPSRAVHA